MDEYRLIRDGDLWAVFVGVNDYDDPEWSSLPYCDNDATCLSSIFMDPVCGYPASNIRLLVNSSKNRHLKPTRSNIIAAINHLAQIADTEDAILFVFFGHGLNVDGVNCIFPSDGFKSDPNKTAIELKWVQETLQNSKAQVKIFIIDACHSGSLRVRGAGRMSEAFAQMLFEEFVKSEGWAVLSSCKQNELSHDYDEKKHGVFTYYLLEGLKGSSDTNRDGFITVYEANQYATKHTKRWAFENGVQQSPELKWNISGGDIVLLRSVREVVDTDTSTPMQPAGGHVDVSIREHVAFELGRMFPELSLITVGRQMTDSETKKRQLSKILVEGLDLAIRLCLRHGELGGLVNMELLAHRPKDFDSLYDQSVDFLRSLHNCFISERPVTEAVAFLFGVLVECGESENREEKTNSIQVFFRGIEQIRSSRDILGLSSQIKLALEQLASLDYRVENEFSASNLELLDNVLEDVKSFYASETLERL